MVARIGFLVGKDIPPTGTVATLALLIPGVDYKFMPEQKRSFEERGFPINLLHTPKPSPKG